MLSIDHLHVQYGSHVRAVQDCSLTVSEGEFVAVIGQNGAGKSTILKAVMGLVPLAEGTITYNGDSVTRRGFSPVRNGIAYVPESRAIFANLTVAENLQLGGTVRRDRRALAEDMVRELERFPVLARYLRRGASLLSGGEQQQLAIARALLTRPRLLLLDEPSLGLAPIVVDLIFDVMVQLREEGVTILLVEQNAVRTLEVADRTYVLQAPGRVIGSGTASELSETTAVVDYLGFKPSEGGIAS